MKFRKLVLLNLHLSEKGIVNRKHGPGPAYFPRTAPAWQEEGDTRRKRNFPQERSFKKLFWQGVESLNRKKTQKKSGSPFQGSERVDVHQAGRMIPIRPFR